jgi:hypothetical protein
VKIVLSSVTVFFFERTANAIWSAHSRNRPMMPIVSETEQIRNWRNLLLKSRAEISDGSTRRFFVVRRRNLQREISALR